MEYMYLLQSPMNNRKDYNLWTNLLSFFTKHFVWTSRCISNIQHLKLGSNQKQTKIKLYLWFATSLILLSFNISFYVVLFRFPCEYFHIVEFNYKTLHWQIVIFFFYNVWKVNFTSGIFFLMLRNLYFFVLFCIFLCFSLSYCFPFKSYKSIVSWQCFFVNLEPLII